MTTDGGDTTHTVNVESDASATEARAELALIVVHHPAPSALHRRLVLGDGQRLTLGRNSALLQAYDSRAISREHASVQRTGSRLLIEDSNSRNGTTLNGQRITRAQAGRGDVIGMGEVLLLVALVDRALAPSLQGPFVAASAEMAEVLRRIQHVAARDATVLLQGPSGSGKDVVARELHRQSGRRGEFVAVNCAGLSDGVLHSELFGHKRGAFSGAERERAGLVAHARAGTLFLDEVGDASAALQASLLRLLEVREYRNVGSDHAQTTDARFIAATHVPLLQAVERGSFRQDLYNRLARWIIELPPLSARPEDIVPLALSSARKWRAEPQLTPELTLALLRASLPGNARELDAVIELAAAEGDGPLALTAAVRSRLSRPSPDRETASPASETVDRSAIERALVTESGSVQRAAEHLGVSRATLYRWLKELGIDPAGIRRSARRRR